MITLTQTPFLVPTRHDTKVRLRRVKEYDGSWINSDIVLFLKGKPSNSKITDIICQMGSKGDLVIVDADFEVLEATLSDYAKHLSA